MADKVAEADFFLDQMNQFSGFHEFRYYLSAFLSASRSVTFCLQSVMSKYPGFDEWYKSRQERLRNNALAKLFVALRNKSQKVGDVAVEQTMVRKDGQWIHAAYLLPTNDIGEVPTDDILSLSLAYFTDLIRILNELYTDFAIYIDPRAIFTTAGLEQLGWSIEDLEESLGFPRGYTDVPWPGDDKNDQRIRLLSKQGGDELMEQYFSKYLYLDNNSK